MDSILPAVFRRRSSHGQTLQLEQIHSFRSPSGTGLRRASFQREHFFATWRCSGTPCPLVMLQHITAFILASCSLHSPQACLENLSSLHGQPTAAVRGGGKEEEQVRSTKPEDIPILASSWGTFPQLRGPGHTIWLIDRHATVLPRQGLQ